MKTKVMIILVLMAALVAPANAAVVVYEGFDYTIGESIIGQGTAADGWDGAWVGSEYNPAAPTALYQYAITNGQTFSDLAVSGGAIQRTNKAGGCEISRPISQASQDALLADNTTMWFSVLMHPGDGNISNTSSTLVFGTDAFVNGYNYNELNYTPPVIEETHGGNAIGVGFNSLYYITGVTYEGGVITSSASTPTGYPSPETKMIVGKIEWAPNGTDDVLTLYSLTTSFEALPEPFAIMVVDVDQTLFDTLAIGDTQRPIFDEIRFGTSYADVTNGPTPANGEIIPLTNPLALSWFNLDPNNPADSVYVDVWFGTDPNVLSTGYNMTKIINAATTGQDVTSVDVDASLEDIYYWQVDSYIYGASRINEPNKIAGPLYSFNAVDDTPPSVVTDPPNWKTWSGEPVTLSAIVTDDGKSALTYEWTVDAVDLADPNLTIVVDDYTIPTPTVTVTKDSVEVPTRWVTLTVAVYDVANPTPVTASSDIRVFDDACDMATAINGENKDRVAGAAYYTDYNDDCITNLADFAEVAAAWLGDYAVTGPIDR